MNRLHITWLIWHFLLSLTHQSTSNNTSASFIRRWHSNPAGCHLLQPGPHFTQPLNHRKLRRTVNYLGMWLLKGDSGAIDEWWVSEQVGGGGGESVTAAGLVVQDSWEADVNCVLQRLQLRLLSPKQSHTYKNISFSPTIPSGHRRNLRHYNYRKQCDKVTLDRVSLGRTWGWNHQGNKGEGMFKRSFPFNQ